MGKGRVAWANRRSWWSTTTRATCRALCAGLRAPVPLPARRTIRSRSATPTAWSSRAWARSMARSLLCARAARRRPCSMPLPLELRCSASAWAFSIFGARQRGRACGRRRGCRRQHPRAGRWPWVDGLGIMRGSCTRLESSRLKVPHVGWDQVHMSACRCGRSATCRFCRGCQHVLHPQLCGGRRCRCRRCLARTHYTRSFPCIVRRGNVWGCQFHPEKSSALGQRILKNFVNIVEEDGR